VAAGGADILIQFNPVNPVEISASHHDDSGLTKGWGGLAAGSHRHVSAQQKLTRPEALAYPFAAQGFSVFGRDGCQMALHTFL